MEKLRGQVLLSLQRALLGAISKNVRGVACAWDDSRIQITAIFDDVISDEDNEAMEIVCSEVVSDFPDHQVGVKCVRLDYPQAITSASADTWVYMRSEK